MEQGNKHKDDLIGLAIIGMIFNALILAIIWWGTV